MSLLALARICSPRRGRPVPCPGRSESAADEQARGNPHLSTRATDGATAPPAAIARAGVMALALLLLAASSCSRSTEPPAPSAPTTGPAAAAPAERPGEPPRPHDTTAESAPPQRDRSAGPAFRELLPGIRVDRDRRLIEFDGHVPINVNDRDTLGDYLVVFLECVVTTPRAEKDHETLVVADIRPSNLHAALLAIGLDPGAPGDWEWDRRQVQRVPARGDEVVVTLRWEAPGGEVIERDARELIVNEKTGEHFGGSAWVFAGSIEDSQAGAGALPPEPGPVPDAPPPPRSPLYAADATGLLVGLATFGTEVIAWREVISHAADVDTPVWIADRATTPAIGTKVTVRVRVGAD
jgi:hypothetical protein